MAFQFQCPQGHLLEGDESQAGQTCTCPTCGMLFIIPQPIAPPAAFSPAAVSAGAVSPAAGAPGAAAAPAEKAGPALVAGAKEPELLHIPCPNGHELETPVEMLDQEVLCPECKARFRLRRKDSIEFKRTKELEERVRLERVGNLWLNWAVAAAVLVIIGLIALVLMTQLNQPAE